MAKGKKDISKLVPVKRWVIRNGQPFQTTVYVRQGDIDKVDNQRGDKPIDTKYIMRKWSRIDSIDDLKFEMNTITHMKHPELREIARNEFVEFMKRSGVKWEEHEDKALNWMRCTMAVKRAIKNNTFVPEGSNRKAEVKPFETMEKSTARAMVKSFAETVKTRKQLHIMIKSAGIEWKHSDHEGINHMRAMMALREHIEDGNAFEPIDVLGMREPNPEYNEKGESKLDKILAESGKERIMTPEMAGAKTFEEMYKVATPMQKKLALLTGIMPKDKTAEDYLKKMIELGHINFDKVLDKFEKVDNLPEFIEEGIRYSAFDNAIYGRLGGWWSRIFDAKDYVVFNGIAKRNVETIFGREGNEESKILLEELEEHCRNFRKMRDKYCPAISMGDISRKATIYNIISKFERYEMAGMLTFNRTTTRKDYLKQVANNVLDTSMMTDKEVEDLFNGLGGYEAFMSTSTYESSAYDMSLLGSLMSLCTTSDFDMETFAKKFLVNAGQQVSGLGVWQRRDNLKDFIKTNKPRKVLEIFAKTLNDFAEDRSFEDSIKHDTCPIDDAFSIGATNYGRRNNIFQIFQMQGLLHDPSISADNLKISEMKNVAGEAMKFHNDKFENDRAKYLQMNALILSEVTKDFTDKRKETFYKRFEPIPYEDFLKIKDNPVKLKGYIKHHIANFYSLKSKKAKKEAKEKLQNMIVNSKYDRKDLALKAIEGKYDDIPVVDWEDLNKIEDGTTIKSAIETVPKTSKEAKDIWSKIQEDENQNESHKKFSLTCHNVFKIKMNYEDEYNKMKEQIGNEQDLYHGTSIYSAQLITGETGRWKTPENIDPNLSTGAMLGRGVYLALQPKKSGQYMGKRGGVTHRWGTRGVMFYCKALLGHIEYTNVRDEYTNQILMNKPTTDTVAILKKGGNIVNDEWAIKRPEQLMPKYMIDMEITHPDKEGEFTTNNQGKKWEYEQRHK